MRKKSPNKRLQSIFINLISSKRPEGKSSQKAKELRSRTKKGLQMDIQIRRKQPTRIDGWSVGPFIFKNTERFAATNFHVVFTGTGGSLYFDHDHDTKVTPPGRCREQVISGGNQLDLYFDPPVPIDGTVDVFVWSEWPNIQVLEWWWTFGEIPPYPWW